MTIDATQFYAVAAALVMLVGGIAAAAIRWSAAQSKAQGKQLASLGAFLRAGNQGANGASNPDATGRNLALRECGPSCRDEVLSEVRAMRDDLLNVTGRLTAVETDVKWLRRAIANGHESDNPGR